MIDTTDLNRDALKATGRPIYYSIHTNDLLPKSTVANQWRTTVDINNKWDTILNRISINNKYVLFNEGYILYFLMGKIN